MYNWILYSDRISYGPLKQSYIFGYIWNCENIWAFNWWIFDLWNQFQWRPIEQNCLVATMVVNTTMWEANTLVFGPGKLQHILNVFICFCWNGQWFCANKQMRRQRGHQASRHLQMDRYFLVSALKTCFFFSVYSPRSLHTQKKKKKTTTLKHAGIRMASS